ncbi:hypothetical protein [Arenibaculum pallidiluteum]|uniref:hypothetical protein n=1 Tax=Arenibaculum pallidiluteum TaxID=2812559 RepID=UPI001A95F4BA|nr:hypothetical protein [Arenibaculum pallidiluteum]
MVRWWVDRTAAEERAKKADAERAEREMALRRAGYGAYVVLCLVLLLPASLLAYYLWPRFPIAPEDAIWLVVFFFAEVLAGLLLVARWFQRLTTNSDIEELRKMAFSYRLGGTLALRPFLNSEGEKLVAGSSIAEYRRGIIEPNFYKSATNPPFFLAVTLVVSLGLFSLFAPNLDLLSQPIIPLLGPAMADWPWAQPGLGTQEKQATLMAYGARALVCLAFAFAGSLVWAVIYLTRRMALRDVTGYTYQELSARLVAGAVIALVAYHFIAPASGELLMAIAFGAGVMPETVLRWIGNRISRRFGASEQNDHIDLEHIQGISAFTRARLAEVGIYDAQGLVSTNPLRLSLHTPYSLPQLIDWYGQCFLLLHFQPKGLAALRSSGLRTVWDLRLATRGQGGGLALGVDTISAAMAGRVIYVLQEQPAYVRTTELYDRMRASVAIDSQPVATMQAAE